MAAQLEKYSKNPCLMPRDQDSHGLAPPKRPEHMQLSNRPPDRPERCPRRELPPTSRISRFGGLPARPHPKTRPTVLIARGFARLHLRLFGPVPQPLQQLLQFRQVQGLHQVSVATSRSRPGAIILLSPAAQRYDDDVASPWLLSDTPRRFVTVEEGHAKIHQNQMWAELLGEIYRLGTVVGGTNLVSHQLEHHFHRSSRVLVIVHHQNAPVCPGGFRSFLGCPGRHLYSVVQDWKPNSEGTALALARTLRLNRSAVHFHQSLHQRQPDS